MIGLMPDGLMNRCMHDWVNGFADGYMIGWMGELFFWVNE